MSIGGLFVVQVNDVDFVELPPLYSATIHVGDAVGGQVCHLDADVVAPFTERSAAVEHIGNGPCTPDEHIINIYASRFTDIAKVYLPVLPCLLLVEGDGGGVDTGSHGDTYGVVVEFFPAVELVKLEGFVDTWGSGGEGKGEMLKC